MKPQSATESCTEVTATKNGQFFHSKMYKLAFMPASTTFAPSYPLMFGEVVTSPS